MSQITNPNFPDQLISKFADFYNKFNGFTDDEVKNYQFINNLAVICIKDEKVRHNPEQITSIEKGQNIYFRIFNKEDVYLKAIYLNVNDKKVTLVDQSENIKLVAKKGADFTFETRNNQEFPAGNYNFRLLFGKNTDEKFSNADTVFTFNIQVKNIAINTLSAFAPQVNLQQ